MGLAHRSWEMVIAFTLSAVIGLRATTPRTGTLPCLPCRVQEHMRQAKRSQAAALKAAQRAYAAALQLESYVVSESAADWLAASQAALEKVQEAFREASGPSDPQTGHVVTAARVAQLLSEVRHTRY